MKFRLPKPIKKKDGWWIPRAPPHYYQSIGPYVTKEEVLDVRAGLLRTINTTAWKLLVLEMEK